MENAATDRIRILAVDDEQGILDLYENIIVPDPDDPTRQDEMEDVAVRLFGLTSVPDDYQPFSLVTCLQGDKAIAAVQQAINEDRPFSVVFLDVKMEPGPDGVFTAAEIMKLDPDVQIVLVTADSDIHPYEISKRVSIPHHLYFLNKPFHNEEIHQFAVTLSKNWLNERKIRQFQVELEHKIRIRTEYLNSLNEDLIAEIEERKALEEQLRAESKKLADMNTALEVLLERKEKEGT
jgi:DNA-binding LytR/AlgR family response regulator